MSPEQVFSLEGQGLRLENAADIEPHIKALRDNQDVREIRLGGNTFGVEACKAVAGVLRSKTTLEVSARPMTYRPSRDADIFSCSGG